MEKTCRILYYIRPMLNGHSSQMGTLLVKMGTNKKKDKSDKRVWKTNVKSSLVPLI